MTATTYTTENAAVVAGTATIDAGESITEAIVLDSKQNLILIVPEFTSGSYLSGDATLLTFQAQAFDGGEFVEAADADGNVLSVDIGAGGRAPCPSEIAGAYAIKVRSGSATGPVVQTAERAIQFVASSPASSTTLPAGGSGVPTFGAEAIDDSPAVQVLPAGDGARAYAVIINGAAGDDTAYIGSDDTVTSATGFPLIGGASIAWPSQSACWAISGSGDSSTVRFIDFPA